jgi:hypothetical protein
MRLGFLGCGKIAMHHAAAFSHLGAAVMAGSARSPGSPKWAAFQAKTGARFLEADALLAAPDVDAIIACLPKDEMAAWLDRLMRSEKPVLLEKPIRPLPQQVGPTNKLVGYNRRFYQTVSKLRERMGRGGLVAAYATLPGDLYGAAIHGLDLLFHLLGPLAWRHAGTTGLAMTMEGKPVSLAMNRDDPINMSIRVYFDDGTSWMLSPLETLTVHQGFEIDGSAIRRYTPRVIDRVGEPVDFKPGFLEQSKAFLSGSYGPGARPQESLRLMEFIDEIP